MSILSNLFSIFSSLALFLFIWNIPEFVVEYIFWRVYLKKLPKLLIKIPELIFISWLLRVIVFFWLVYVTGFAESETKTSVLTEVVVFTLPHVLSALFMWTQLNKEYSAKSRYVLWGAVFINALTIALGMWILQYVSDACGKAGGC